jgi:4-amino-4-deoxychorismate lyase
MYPLLETIAISDFNAPYIAFHQQRMDDSFLQLFHQPNPFRLEVMLKQITVPTPHLYKWRILYGKDGVESSMALYEPRVIKKIAFHEIPIDFDYSLKYSDRSFFEQVKSQYSDCDEVVLLKNGFFTDSLYANLAIEIKNEAQLFTPSTPLLAGTHRKRLLKEGILKEKRFNVEEISLVKKIVFINAMGEFENSPFFDMENFG